jgi:hypothetical protein
MPVALRVVREVDSLDYGTRKRKTVYLGIYLLSWYLKELSELPTTVETPFESDTWPGVAARS